MLECILLLSKIAENQFKQDFVQIELDKNQRKTQCLCDFIALGVIIPHPSILLTIPVAFIYLLLFSTLNCAKNPVFMRVFVFEVKINS